MLELENLKVEDLSKSVKRAPHSEQATGHGMHCREILFTPHCSSRASEFPGSGRLFCTTYGCGATGRQTCPIFGFWPLSEVHALHRVPSSYQCCEHDILKTNETIWLQIGTSGPQGKDETTNFWGQRSRSQDAKVTFGGLVEASFWTHSVE